MNQIFGSDFGTKPQRSRIFTSFFLIRPLLMAIFISLISHILSTTTAGFSAPALTNTLIYFTHISNIKLISRACI